MKKRLLIFSFLLFFLLSCSYSVYSSALPHLKTVLIENFSNSTKEYTIQQDLQKLFDKKFRSWGRLSIVTLTPDCIFGGKILSYSDKVNSYIGSTASSYVLTIVLEVYFIDDINSKKIWDNKKTYSKTYFSSNQNNVDYYIGQTIDNTTLNSFDEIKTKFLTDLVNDLIDDLVDDKFSDW